MAQLRELDQHSGRGEADASPGAEGGGRAYLLQRQRGRGIDGGDGGEQAVINYVVKCDEAFNQFSWFVF